MYQPVQCELHDELELLALRHQLTDLEYDDGVAVRKVRGRIADIEIRGKAEFLVLETGVRIRLDMLKTVNGHLYTNP